jgi:putative transcriptional regulator
MIAANMKNRIRVLRAEKNWTQAELAKRLDVSRNTMNAIENNRYDPSLSLAFRLAKLFGLKMEDVFQDED